MYGWNKNYIIFIITFKFSGTKNSEISYRILHSDYSIESFSIDSVTGFLKPIRPVDFEKLQNRKSVNSINGNLRPINLVVQAQDHGLPSLSDETHVVIYVEDVNDFGPKFESQNYETSISEDLSGGSTVLKVTFNTFFIIILNWNSLI